MANGNSPDGPRPAVGQGLTRNARNGLVLFLIYCVFYGGFVAINGFAAERMQEPVAWLGGINLAVAYGMGLIAMAFLLAMVYMAMCRAADDLHEEGGK